jgi:hypothetical protein
MTVVSNHCHAVYTPVTITLIIRETITTEYTDGSVMCAQHLETSEHKNNNCWEQPGQRERQSKVQNRSKVNTDARGIPKRRRKNGEGYYGTTQKQQWLMNNRKVKPSDRHVKVCRMCL